jgi:hypothetical protein
MSTPGAARSTYDDDVVKSAGRSVSFVAPTVKTCGSAAG